jgi:hypothetical protein
VTSQQNLAINIVGVYLTEMNLGDAIELVNSRVDQPLRAIYKKGCTVRGKSISV